MTVIRRLHEVSIEYGVRDDGKKMNHGSVDMLVSS